MITGGGKGVWTMRRNLGPPAFCLGGYIELWLKLKGNFILLNAVTTRK